ncbi:ribonuclease H-like domain-containing protein [Neobacillus niacini]|uniref:ribonuclease H-like domain-containing protein n=1 Tax=Neobacillus niacini TaxID=86668 RepID=UPI0007AC1717|nr:ribonuclease H-like domain-containing protein [Neobacillus niacini]MEC1521446.1 ribonuclease H-like domain-containing protein [Neobacillus niacini]
MSLKNKLNRLKPHISGGASPINNTPPKTARIEIPFLSKWESENVTPYYLDQDYCLIREVKYPLSQKHGHYHFHDFLTAVDIWNKQPISHPLSAEGHSAEELFFFDTETTGLGGGTGNTIFLLGYASVVGENLVLRQHILPHPGAEVPLYQSFLENVNYKTLVTYNGKSFDWPQVKTRHTLVRDHVPKLPAFGHFDLFHAAKRLWKHKLERLKLAVVEKEVLGVERQDDIPGYLAPMIYFDFVESKQPDGMLGIIKHNEIDILSLVTLYTHITYQLCGIDNNQTRKESFEVGRWYAALGEKAEAAKVLTKLVEGSDFTSLQAKLALAYQSKKEQNWEISLSLFKEVADVENPKLSVDACIEASKIYEHKIKDYKLALDYCLKASVIVENTNSPMQKVQQQIETRLTRLEGKFAKFPRQAQHSSTLDYL